VAADGEGQNGLFTEKLLQHMVTPGLGLEKVFKRVRADVQRDSNSQQVPWDSSSVTGDFYFVRGVAPTEPVTALDTLNTQQSELATAQKRLEEERQRVTAELAALEAERKLAETQRQIAEERRKLEAEKTRLAEAKRLAEAEKQRLAEAERQRQEAAALRQQQEETRKQQTSSETVIDPKTGLMWQKGETGRMNWERAKSYCQNLSLAGYTDWQLPDRETLQQMFAWDEGGHYSKAELQRMFPGIRPAFYWSSTTDVVIASDAWLVGFGSGSVGYYVKSYSVYVRCVRGSK
jgi:flagellar biosynthesis GTPase FlhF